LVVRGYQQGPDGPRVAQDAQAVGRPRPVQLLRIRLEDAQEHIKQRGAGVGQPFRVVPVLIDEPKGRALLQRRVGRLPEDFRDPVVSALVFATRPLSRTIETTMMKPARTTTTMPQGPLRRNSLHGSGKMLQRKNPTRIATSRWVRMKMPMLPRSPFITLIFAQRSGRVNYGQSLFL